MNAASTVWSASPRSPLAVCARREQAEQVRLEQRRAGGPRGRDGVREHRQALARFTELGHRPAQEAGRPRVHEPEIVFARNLGGLGCVDPRRARVAPDLVHGGDVHQRERERERVVALARAVTASSHRATAASARPPSASTRAQNTCAQIPVSWPP